MLPGPGFELSVLPEPGFVYAPVIEGQFAGYAYICIGNCTVGKVPVVYGKTLEQTQEIKKPFWSKFLKG